MTLDHGCKPTIKGHFCSLLISNIFSNPLFLLSPPAHPYNSADKGEIRPTEKGVFLATRSISDLRIYTQDSTILHSNGDRTNFFLSLALALFLGQCLLFHWTVPPLHL